MKNKPTLIVISIFLILCFIYSIYIFGWKKFISNKDTPKDYLNYVVASSETYKSDSLKVVKELEIFLKNNQDTFYSRMYDDSTSLSVDTILYSPNFNKISLLIIAKYPMSRREVPDDRYEWYYAGFCYLGNRVKDSITLTSLDPSFSSHSKAKVIKLLKINYFRLLATVKDIEGRPKYKYNLNDLRFWNSPIWQDINNSRLEKIRFEKEKKEHPENIYEPNH